MKRITISIVFLFILGLGKSQNSFPSYLTTNTYLNNYVQPSPNVASLGKFVDYPVSYYTGVPQIDIPLYQLKDGAANISVSLNYHASGIKVSETASWVGLGWALSAGGMITRTVRGAPDEGSGKSWGPGTGPSGYYASFGLSTLPLLPTDQAFDMALNTYPPSAIMAGYMDTEPDLFTFSFNGKSGKFVFDENRVPHTLENSDIIITPSFSGGSFGTWTITDEEGTKYFFGEDSAFEITQPSSYLGSGIVDSRSNFPSSWFLTRVVYPNTKDTIYLTYTSERYKYRDLPPESKTYDFSNMYNACINDVPNTDVLQTAIIGRRLTNIRSKNYNIVFAAHTQRTDLTPVFQQPLPYSLDSVNIYTSTGQCLKRWQLSYSYFNSSFGSTTSRVSALLSLLKDSTDTRRLKLTAVKEISGDGTFSKPAYSLNYSETLPLPRRLSYDQDDWGYSNNYLGYANPFFTPKLSGGYCNSPSLVGANKTPKWPDMQAFSLISMVDPLGVTTNFVFEAHGINVGGIRVKQITTTDSVTGMVNYRNFTYADQYIFQKPVYLIIPLNEYYFDYSTYSVMNFLTGYMGYYSSQPYANVTNILKQSQSIAPLQDMQGNHIGYGTVKESFGIRGEGGSKVYTYRLYGAGSEDSRLDIANFTTFKNYISASTGASVALRVGNGLFPTTAASLTYHSSYINNIPLYPIAPKQIMIGRGNLLEVDTYDSTNTLVNSVSNQYYDSLNENLLIRGLKVLRTINTNGQNVDAFTFYKLHAGICHLVGKIVTDYKDGKKMVTTTKYAYESSYHNLKTSETKVNSVGDTVITKTYYSFDYAPLAISDSIFRKMSARNMLVPISTRVWKNGYLIRGTITQYKNFASSSLDTFINPAKTYSFETTTPFTPTQAGESIALTGRFSSLLPNSNFIEKADYKVNGTTGKLIEQKLVYDKNQTLIWDNQLHLPLAQVDNAYFSDVAYTSFESAEPGNWSISTGAIVSDTTAPTGDYAYNLSSGSISKSGLTGSQSYVISYWSKSGASISITGGTLSGSISGRTLNGYTYHEVKVTAATAISLSGSGYVDEVRLYPAMAQMNTYTYDPLLRLVATCSVNSTISYYEYDSMNRVVDIKDQFGNILKAYEYNYGRLSR